MNIDAAVDGSSPALAWADNEEQPSSALVWDGKHHIYLGGTADDEQFNRDIAALLAEEIVPQAREKRVEVLLIQFAAADWEAKLAQLLPGLTLQKYPRVFYALDEPKIPDWRERVPEGFSIQPIDRAILENDELANVGSMRDEIALMWGAVEPFLERGFGFCALHGQEIACWCTGEYFSPGKSGIGIETVEQYQRRGLATLTAAAFVEHSLAQGRAPHWDSWRRNTASVATAEKVGFRLLREYDVYLAFLEEE